MADVTLEFLGRQMERLLNDMATMKDDVTVLTAMVARIDSSHGALLTELRALHSKVSRIETRLTKLESA
jgi:ABC-type transporter Mla MlaB component